jgi:YegS/Rv2252/BmrU family lipid kinase
MRLIQVRRNMNHLFIVNPVAGKGKALRFVKRIQREAKKVLEDFSLKITHYPGHATEIAREFVKKGPCRIYSVGGDGTLNEVVNGMAGSSSSLAVIPAGSGNDFMRSISEKYDLQHIIPKCIRGTDIPVDLVKVNDKYFINVSSMGFDSDVAHATNIIKKIPLIPSQISYLLGILAALIKCKSYPLKVYIDGECIEDEMLLAVIANGRYYGKGIKPAPLARFDDGYLDVCLVRKKRRLEILRLLPRFAKGKHDSIEGVSFYRGKNVMIQCSSNVRVNLDGEVEQLNEVLYEIIPGGIKIAVPASNT